MKKFANPSRLNMTEINKEKICKLLENEFIDSETIAEKLNFSYVRAYSLMTDLVKEGYLIFELRKMQISEKKSSQRRFYTSTGKKYIPIIREVNTNVKRFRPHLYYGYGEFFNPFAPKIPEGGITRKVELFNTKDKDYFKQPLKKLKSNGIGSTFSIYQDYAL